MVPLPGSATRMSPAVVGATAELGLTNIGERLRMGARSAPSTTRVKIRMKHLSIRDDPLLLPRPGEKKSGEEKDVFPTAFLQLECQTSARRLTVWKERHHCSRAGLRGATSAILHQGHVDVPTVAGSEIIAIRPGDADGHLLRCAS